MELFRNKTVEVTTMELTPDGFSWSRRGKFVHKYFYYWEFESTDGNTYFIFVEKIIKITIIK